MNHSFVGDGCAIDIMERKNMAEGFRTPLQPGFTFSMGGDWLSMSESVVSLLILVL